jgi:hypothetical protein
VTRAEDDLPAVVRAFSICEGGPLYRIARRLGLPPRRFIPVGVILALITWLPLVVLAALGHVLMGGASVPFSQSFGTHARLLVAIPLFFVAESLFDSRVAEVIRKLVQAGVIPPRELPRLTDALQRTLKWTTSWVVEAALAGLTIAFISAGVRSDLPVGVSTWREAGGGGLTLAGWWYTLVSLPVFQFLLWRWCWRLLVWCRLLWWISRLHLQLTPTHPDLAGGLGGFGVAHVDLSPLIIGCNAMLAASVAESVTFGGARLDSFVLPIATAVVGSTLTVLAPLLVFTTRLLEVKQRGLLEYGALATNYTRAFDSKWLRGGEPTNESILGTADVQSLADLANSFNIIRSMRIVPVATSQIVLIVAAAALPVAPLALVLWPLDELILRGVKTILGI